MIADSIGDALAALAAAPSLLIASDYDGTIAPIVDDPAAARPLDAAVGALHELARLPHTSVALISGRSRRDLRKLSHLGHSDVQLIGSHGIEFEGGIELTADQHALLQTIAGRAASIASAYEGVTVEEKPASVAIHYRKVDHTRRQEARHAITERLRWLPDVEVTKGKSVLEFAVVPTDKGYALDVLREQAAATAAVFFGDDVTDENAFGRLGESDVGVKVGPGETLAEYRVDSPHDVAEALTLLLSLRAAYVTAAAH